MARPWRIQYEGAIYHVMSRGVGRGKIFLTNDDYSRFLKYMASAKEKFKLDMGKARVNSLLLTKILSLSGAVAGRVYGDSPLYTTPFSP